jgi:hypothetical protein
MRVVSLAQQFGARTAEDALKRAPTSQPSSIRASDLAKRDRAGKEKGAAETHSARIDPNLQRTCYLPFLGPFSSFLPFFFIADLLAVAVGMTGVAADQLCVSYTSEERRCQE